MDLHGQASFTSLGSYVLPIFDSVEVTSWVSDINMKRINKRGGFGKYEITSSPSSFKGEDEVYVSRVCVI